MKTATILHDVSMTHWPPDTYLIEVDPAVTIYNSLTGQPDGEYKHLAVQIPRSEMIEDSAAVYPAGSDGTFVDETLAPILKWPGTILHSVLKSMGYEVTN